MIELQTGRLSSLPPHRGTTDVFDRVSLPRAARSRLSGYPGNYRAAKPIPNSLQTLISLTIVVTSRRNSHRFAGA
jgi:hypothetical protein